MPPLAAVPDLDRELDELYGSPLEGFTRTRNELARKLKRAHQTEAASHVQALRKPSLAAWTVNRLSRQESRLVDALLKAGESLRDAQTKAMAGEAVAADVHEASTAEREAVRALLARARDLLGERATPGLIDRISQTLRAAAVADDARLLLRLGRLTEEVQPVGFGPLTAVRPVAPQREDDRRKRQAVLRELRADARRCAQEAAYAARAADDAEREARRLREEADSRRTAADRAAAAVAAEEGSDA